jgi:hypothetical protein
MSANDAVSDVLAIREAIDMIVKRCQDCEAAKSPSKSETERLDAFIVEIGEALDEVLRVHVSEAEESVIRLDEVRGMYRKRLDAIDEEKRRDMDTAIDLANEVMTHIGHISPDESLAVHRMRMLSMDIKEAQ